MSTRNIALTAVAGIGALVTANILKPSKTQSIAAGMRNQLDDFNSSVHPKQNRRCALPEV
jgi:hypothetical protein